MFKIDFTWQRPAKCKGFVWKEDAGGLFLVRRAEAPFEDYKPLEYNTGLFRSFAEVEETPEGVLNFANSYGYLGEIVGAAFGPPSGLGWLGQPQHFNTWCVLISVMREAVDIFNNLASGNLEKIGWLYHTVFKNLSPEVLKPQIALTSKRQPQVTFIPQNLFAAMIVQLARAVLGDKTYQRCQACGKWFELAPGLNRADRQSCSVSCRVKLYRGRQAQARKLHSQGWSIRKIAKELGSEIDTIKNWLSKN